MSNFIMKTEGTWKKQITPSELPEGTEFTSADQLLVSPSSEEETKLNNKYNEYKTAILSDLKEGQTYSLVSASAWIKDGEVFLSLLKNITSND